MKNTRVLIVDDEPGIRESLRGVLEDEGCTCEAVESGEQCLEELQRHAYDVVLLDVWLPGMDGLETLARIQEIPFADRPEVVMISGHGTIETAVKATKLGAFDFLEKPLTIEKVMVVIHNAVQQRRLELELSRLKDGGEHDTAHHRRKRADEGAAPAVDADGRHQRARADFRRERNGQGADRPCDPRRQLARRRAVRRGELRGDPGGNDRERAVRPPQGRFRGRGGRQDRQARKSARRDAVPGRSRRHVPEDPGQGSARARRAALRAGRRGRFGPGGRARGGRPPTRIWKKRSSGEISARICSTGST